MNSHNSDIVLNRRQLITSGRQLEKYDSSCHLNMKPHPVVRTTDELNSIRCQTCGGPGVFDGHCCRECTMPEKDASSPNNKRFLIGSIDQVVRWHKVAKATKLYVIYEVTAILDSICCSAKGQYNMILRDNQNASITPLQAVFFPIDRDLPKIHQRQLVTFVGRMIGANKLHVFDMWPAQVSPESLECLKRLSFFCQRVIHETR